MGTNHDFIKKNVYNVGEEIFPKEGKSSLSSSNFIL